MGHDSIRKAIVLWDASRVIYTRDGIIPWRRSREDATRHRQRHPSFPTIVFLDAQDDAAGQGAEDDTVESRPKDDGHTDPS